MAGAPPPSKTIARVEEELGWEFNQIYGLTETAPLLTINRPRAEYDDLEPEERAKRLSRAGVPALGTRLPVSESGEVLAQSNVVLAGYWENPDASAEALDGGWFHTGDGGSIDDGGYLTISDRKKDVIITGGENVSSIEVEDAVFSHPAVAEVAVIGVPDDKWGELVTALVVVAEGEQVSEADIIAHCRGKIAGYKIPKRIEFRDALAAHGHRQDPEVQAARVVLEGLRAPGELTKDPAAPTARQLAAGPLQRGRSRPSPVSPRRGEAPSTACPYRRS